MLVSTKLLDTRGGVSPNSGTFPPEGRFYFEHGRGHVHTCQAMAMLTDLSDRIAALDQDKAVRWNRPVGPRVRLDRPCSARVLVLLAAYAASFSGVGDGHSGLT